MSFDLFHTGGAWQYVPLRVLALQVPLVFLVVRGSLQKREILTSPSLFMYTAAIFNTPFNSNPMMRAC